MSLPGHLPISICNPGFASAVTARLEAAFVADLRRSLPVNPFLNESGRATLGRLIAERAPVRTIGDAYMLEGFRDWVRKNRRRFGSDAVRVTSHGPERLFEPFPDEKRVVVQGLASRKKAFFKAFEALDDTARPVFEIRTRLGIVHRSGSQMLPIAFWSFQETLHPLGFRLSEWPTGNNDPDDSVTLRYFSIAALETGLRVFLGDEKAPRFCRASGFVQPRRFNGLHFSSVQALGQPVSPRRIHDVEVDAWGFPLHDAAHAALWAVKLEPEERRAGALLWEAFADTVPPAQRNEKTRYASNIIGDLDYGHGELPNWSSGLQSRLPAPIFRKLMTRFQRLQDRYRSLET